MFFSTAGAHRPLGIEGWRFAFLTVAVVSVVVGLLNIIFVHDPSWAQHEAHETHEARGAGAAATSDGSGGQSGGGGRGSGMQVDLTALWQEIGSIMVIPTFLIIIVQASGPTPVPLRTFPSLYLMGLARRTGSGCNSCRLPPKHPATRGACFGRSPAKLAVHSANHLLLLCEIKVTGRPSRDMCPCDDAAVLTSIANLQSAF